MKTANPFKNPLKTAPGFFLAFSACLAVGGITSIRNGWQAPVPAPVTRTAPAIDVTGIIAEVGKGCDGSAYFHKVPIVGWQISKPGAGGSIDARSFWRQLDTSGTLDIKRFLDVGYGNRGIKRVSVAALLTELGEC